MSGRQTRLPSGALLQAGLATQANPPRASAGITLRGVVMATYTVDSTSHPSYTATPNVYVGTPAAIYCDVLIVSVLRGFQKIFMPKVMVSQDVGGMHRGAIWKPRPATMCFSGKPLDPTNIDPYDLDGDHVLVSFIDNSLTSPVIIRGLPHPIADANQGGKNTPPLKTTMRLHGLQNDPSLWKHHGTNFGISGGGDFQVNTTYANDGNLLQGCAEPPPPTDGTLGNLLLLLQGHAQRLTRLIDMSNPGQPRDLATEILNSTSYTLSFLTAAGASTASLNVTGAGSETVATVGDGAKHAAVVEELFALYTDLKTKFDMHFHNTSIGPSATAMASGFVAPTWRGAIYGAHLGFPATQTTEIPAGMAGV